MDDEKYGERLRELRVFAGLSAVELAKRVGVSPVYLTDVERGRRAPFSTPMTVAVSRALDNSPVELLGLASLERDCVEIVTKGMSDRHIAFITRLAASWDKLGEMDVALLLDTLGNVLTAGEHLRD